MIDQLLCAVNFVAAAEPGRPVLTYSRAIGSLRMGVDRENLVSVILESEIEPPRASNPGLPDIACLIIFLCS